MKWASFFGRGVFWVVAALAVLFIFDWGVFHLRGDAAVGQVTVGVLQVASMKGNKEEYFPDGTEVVQCSRSIFPQTGAGPCWWVVRHRTVFER